MASACPPLSSIWGALEMTGLLDRVERDDGELNLGHGPLLIYG